MKAKDNNNKKSPFKTGEENAKTHAARKVKYL